MSKNNSFSSHQIEQLRGLFQNSEDRVTSHLKDYINASVTAKINAAKIEILDGVADLMDNVVSPQLDNHEHRLSRLEKANGIS